MKQYCWILPTVLIIWLPSLLPRSFKYCTVLHLFFLLCDFSVTVFHTFFTFLYPYIFHLPPKVTCGWSAWKHKFYQYSTNYLLKSDDFLGLFLCFTSVFGWVSFSASYWSMAVITYCISFSPFICLSKFMCFPPPTLSSSCFFCHYCTFSFFLFYPSSLCLHSLYPYIFFSPALSTPSFLPLLTLRSDATCTCNRWPMEWCQTCVYCVVPCILSTIPE